MDQDGEEVEEVVVEGYDLIRKFLLAYNGEEDSILGTSLSI